ncbi:MAG: helix-turn-helix domain-containing protein [bacterium]
MNGRKLGDILKERREALNLSIKEVADATKLKKSIIVALENGDYRELPEPVYIRGFLKLYALVLGLDYRELSLLLDKELESAGKVEKEYEEEKRNLFLPLLTLIIVIGVVVSIFYFLSLRRQLQNPKILGQPPPISNPIQQPVQGSSQSSSPEGAKKIEPIKKEVVVDIEGLDYSWLRVTVDNNKVFEGFINKGDHFEWKGVDRIKIRIGNAGGVSVIVNGQDLGVLGKRGEVLEREFLPK